MHEEMAIKTLVRVEREQALLKAGESAVGFSMGIWFNEINAPGLTDQMGNLCSTVACFAGHAAMVAGWMPTLYSNHCRNPETGEIARWSEVGEEVLSLTCQEANRVFYLDNLDEVYRWVADRLGIDEQVLRDKVRAEVG